MSRTKRTFPPWFVFSSIYERRCIRYFVSFYLSSCHLLYILRHLHLPFPYIFEPLPCAQYEDRRYFPDKHASNYLYLYCFTSFPSLDEGAIGWRPYQKRTRDQIDALTLRSETLSMDWFVYLYINPFIIMRKIWLLYKSFIQALQERLTHTYTHIYIYTRERWCKLLN